MTVFCTRIQDSKDVRELLKRSNVSDQALADFADEAATSCSGLQNPEIVRNHRGEKDVALFDFTTMHESENASRIVERRGKKLLLCVAGDTLLQVLLYKIACAELYKQRIHVYTLVIIYSSKFFECKFYPLIFLTAAILAIRDRL